MSEGTLPFLAGERERTGQALTFTLGGRQWHCRPKLPFGLVGNLVAQLEDGGLGVFDAFAALVVKAVRRDERAEFRELLYAIPEEDDDVIDLQDVASAAQLIVERVTGNPFASSSASPVGPSSTGGTPPGPADSADTTSLPHRHVRLS